MARTQELERVSEELQRTLELEARRVSANRKDEVATLLNSERYLSSYKACIWWDGCYYCKDDHNDWYCIRCTFF